MTSKANILPEVTAWLRAYATTLRGGLYFVKRGWINWGSFPFEKLGAGFAIMVPETSLGPTACGFYEAKFSFELAASMPTKVETPGVDDGIQEQMTSDIYEMMRQLARATREGVADNLVIEIRLGESVVREFHDAADRVQGITVTVPISF